MVQLFVRKDDEGKEDNTPEVKPEMRQAEQTAERLESREEMEKKKAEEVLRTTSGSGSAWVGDAETKLREAQASYETEKLRQDLLGEISGMNTEQIAKLNDLSKAF